ncbi:MAG: helix-turn-helix domain-containing protein, partial [Chloroflexota bacterium]
PPTPAGGAFWLLEGGLVFSPTVLRLLRLLYARPGGVSLEELSQHLADTPQEWVDRALDRLLEAGLVELRGDRLVPTPKLKPLAARMVLLANRLNEGSQALDLVRLLFPRNR